MKAKIRNVQRLMNAVLHDVCVHCENKTKCKDGKLCKTDDKKLESDLTKIFKKHIDFME